MLKVENILKKAKDAFSRWRSFLFLGICIFVELMYMHWQVNGQFLPKNVPRYLWMLTFDVNGIVLLYSLLPIRNSKWIGIPLSIVCIYVIGNVLFSRFITGYMPLNAWMETNNLHGLADSIIYGFRWSDFMMVAIVLVLYLLGTKHKIPFPSYRQRFGVLFCSSIVLFVGYARISDMFSKSSLMEWQHKEFKLTNFVWNRQSYTFNRGVLCTLYGELFWNDRNSRDLTDKDKQEIKNALSRKPFEQMLQKPNNILFIIVESLISAPIDYVVDGKEVTPILNKLKRSGFYCGNMSSECQKGNSSDGQFIYFTGLLPKHNGFTVVDYTENEYQGLGTLTSEAGYFSVLLNPANKSFWRQDLACQQYGINKHYAIEDYKATIGNTTESWLNDEQIFEYAYQLIKENLKKNLFITILTSSMHVPYNQDFDKALREFPSVENKDYACYLQKVNYTDHHLGLFLEKLDKDSLLDDFLIVLTADHPAPNLFDKKAPRLKMPLFICGESVKPQETDKELRQTDLYPSLLNIIGYCHLPYMGLGHSVFDEYDTKRQTTEYQDSIQYISDMIIDSNYFHCVK